MNLTLDPLILEYPCDKSIFVLLIRKKLNISATFTIKVLKRLNNVFILNKQCIHFKKRNIWTIQKKENAL